MPSPRQAAADAKKELARLSRPSENFDASRYFRGADGLRFHNVGTTTMRAQGWMQATRCQER